MTNIYKCDSMIKSMCATCDYMHHQVASVDIQNTFASILYMVSHHVFPAALRYILPNPSFWQKEDCSKHETLQLSPCKYHACMKYKNLAEGLPDLSLMGGDKGSWLCSPWWCYDIATFSTILALCEGNYQTLMDHLHKGQVMLSLMGFFLLLVWTRCEQTVDLPAICSTRYSIHTANAFWWLYPILNEIYLILFFLCQKMGQRDVTSNP